MKLIIRKASVRWKNGICVTATKSGTLKQAKFSSDDPLKSSSHTDPAELLAAAHASSFSLALAKELGLEVGAVGEIVTTTTVTVTQKHYAAVWAIINIHLNVIARLPRVTQGDFIDAAVRAKTNCLVSQLLRANISMNAKLEEMCS